MLYECSAASCARDRPHDERSAQMARSLSLSLCTTQASSNSRRSTTHSASHVPEGRKDRVSREQGGRRKGGESVAERGGGSRLAIPHRAHQSARGRRGCRRLLKEDLLLKTATSKQGIECIGRRCHSRRPSMDVGGEGQETGAEVDTRGEPGGYLRGASDEILPTLHGSRHVTIPLWPSRFGSPCKTIRACRCSTVARR
ncbi:hypothetical protein B0H13DRAFT_2010170 [Mycena leptocephala]|nr:hypothetical protein B0H13DRAFT_2010170 [Mycena leptocephala]